MQQISEHCSASYPATEQVPQSIVRFCRRLSSWSRSGPEPLVVLARYSKPHKKFSTFSPCWRTGNLGSIRGVGWRKSLITAYIPSLDVAAGERGPQGDMDFGQTGGVSFPLSSSVGSAVSQATSDSAIALLWERSPTLGFLPLSTALRVTIPLLTPNAGLLSDKTGFPLYIKKRSINIYTQTTPQLNSSTLARSLA